MRWCRNALSDGVVRAARHVGQGPLACPVLGTVRVAEAPGSRAAAGRRAAIAERPLGLEGRPGNLRGANHTITDVTGRGQGLRSPAFPGQGISDFLTPRGGFRTIRTQPRWVSYTPRPSEAESDYTVAQCTE